MQVMLINSPLFDEPKGTTEFDLPPFGLAYIATELEIAGCDVRLIDSINEHYGISRIVNIIHNQKPQFVGLNVFSANMDIVKEIVEQISIKTNIVIGGRVVEHVYDEILNWKTENKLICIIGEGELIWPALAKGELEKIIYKNNVLRELYKVDRNSPFFPNNLDQILLNRKYINSSNRKPCNEEDYLITSRGCIYDCAFCGGAASYNSGGKIRSRSLNNIENEVIEILESNKDLKSIRILDDLFLTDRNKIVTAINLFNQFPKLNWRAMAHVIPLLNNSDLLQDLKNSGCDELFIGIESGSDKIRQFIRKEGTVANVKSVINNILKNEINVKGYFIYGFPNENEEDFKLTLELSRQLKKLSAEGSAKFRTSVFQFKPYHGTKLYTYLIEHGYNISAFKMDEIGLKVTKKENYYLGAGNFSQCSNETIKKYINLTLELNEEE